MRLRLMLAAMLPVLGLAGIAVAVPPDDAPVNIGVTCGTSADLHSAPPATHRIRTQGTDVSLDVGINANRNVAGATVDVLEARALPATGGENYLNAIDWAPVYANTSNGQYPSPCPGYSSPSVDNGALDIAALPVPTGAGDAITMTAAYTLQSKYNQVWWSSDQAYFVTHDLNLEWLTASYGNLRFYVGGRGEATIGPYMISQNGEITRMTRENPAVAQLSFSANRANEYGHILPKAGRFVALVWNLWGQDTVVVIPDLSHGGYITMIDVGAGGAYPICSTNLDPLLCGLVQWSTPHLLVDGGVPYQVGAGSKRQFSQTYLIGTTKAQVAALGFDIP